MIYRVNHRNRLTYDRDWGSLVKKSSCATYLGVIRQSSDKPQKPRGKPVRISTNPDAKRGEPIPTALPLDLIDGLGQCFSTAGPWHQLYRAARGSPGICHFSFLSIFHQ